MKLFLTITIMAVLAITALSPEWAYAQQREEITVVIPLSYMSASIAAQLFGGTVIAPGGFYGGSAGGYGSYSGGQGIGGLRGYGSGYGGFGSNAGRNGGYGQGSSGYGGYGRGNNYGYRR